MHRFLLLCCLSLLCLASCQSDPDMEEAEIELPVKVQEGYGPFEARYSAMFEEHTTETPGGASWVPTYRPVKGIPKDWRKVVKSMIWLNGYQVVYQNFHEGKISREMYEDLQKSWEWTPDELALSKKPIKCFVYTVRGIDRAGSAVVMIDTNNNLDFSDETAFQPEKLFGTGKTMNWDSMRTYKKLWRVAYERVENGEIVQDTLPLLVKHAVDHDERGSFWYSIPRHGKATLKRSGKAYEILVHNDFARTTFYESELFTEADRENGKRLSGRGVAKGEVIKVGDLLNQTKYRFAGVSWRTGAIRLQWEDAALDGYSTQRGYRFKPFEATDFRTKKPLALSDFDGKYVFIDFWGTWCGPCVEDLPGLREIYKETDKTRVQFIGIVGEDSRERLNRFLAKNQLEWPQILSDSVNKLIETYDIQSYPTTVLVGPDGRVVAKNLRGNALKEKLREISGISSL
ncbi:TlpA family protein disulfide reductase [Dyadobacter crusticola]|uniref:TlpA family protein disulfide reductase n=1 Tax=Dyadobacter crusticola TaxID=292407 RepID=UPI0004E0BCE0|nr:TlpA disulfide reductase family protein [Dyadobacter crusticola]